MMLKHGFLNELPRDIPEIHKRYRELFLFIWKPPTQNKRSLYTPTEGDHIYLPAVSLKKTISKDKSSS